MQQQSAAAAALRSSSSSHHHLSRACVTMTRQNDEGDVTHIVAVASFVTHFHCAFKANVFLYSPKEKSSKNQFFVVTHLNRISV